MRTLRPLAAAGLVFLAGCLGGCGVSRPPDSARLTLNNPKWDRVNVQLVITRATDCDSRGDGFIDSREVLAFLKTWKAKAVVYPKLEAGEIKVYKHGFDVILALDEAFGQPRGGGKSAVWTSTVRLFSPEYCRGKKIRPYEEELVAGLRFPLTRDTVRRQLGKPPLF